VRAFETIASKKKAKGIPGLAPPTNGKAIPHQQNQKSSDGKPKSNPKSSVSETKSIELQMESVTISRTEAKSTEPSSSNPDAELSQANSTEKRLKALRKKLREIEEISKKNASELTPEQVDKLNKRESIEQEISSLESAKNT
jgi:hypothetical protein